MIVINFLKIYRKTRIFTGKITRNLMCFEISGEWSVLVRQFYVTSAEQ